MQMQRHGRTKSIPGANVQSCIERFGFTMDALLGNSCVGQTIDDINVKADSPANIIDALWLLWNC